MKRAPVDRVRSRAEALSLREDDEHHYRQRHERLRRQRLHQQWAEQAGWLDDDDVVMLDDLSEEGNDPVREATAPIG